MQHFSKSTWDEHCTLLKKFGHTVIPNFLEYGHIIWLARWIFRASLQITCATACTLHRASQKAEWRNLSLSEHCVIGTLENKACNLPHPAHFQSCKRPIPPSHHTARFNWKTASLQSVIIGTILCEHWHKSANKIADMSHMSCSFNLHPETCRD